MLLACLYRHDIGFCTSSYISIVLRVQKGDNRVLNHAWKSRYCDKEH